MGNLLENLKHQVTDQLFSYSIVIVDNDPAGSAKHTVESFKNKTIIPVDYYHEAEPNIALARNKAIESAKGNFIAFIDDDEFPEKMWLLNLYKAEKYYNADGVLGPVVPHFDGMPPCWLVRGRFCERPSFETGTILHWDNTRTGNVLFRKSVFYDPKNRFDPRFGRTGGEDSEFFEQVIRQGLVFIWCNEAVVSEVVPQERWTRTFYIKRSIRIGGLTGEKARAWPTRYTSLAKIIFSFSVCALILPASVIGGQCFFMRVLTKALYSASWLLGFCGVVVIRYRE